MSIRNLFKSWFGRPEVPSIRPLPAPDAPEIERRTALELIDVEPRGFIRCPFCLYNPSGGDNATMLYDKRQNMMHCDHCRRSGSMKTLRTRLQSYDAYREVVK